MKALRLVLLAIAFVVVAGLVSRLLHPGWKAGQTPPTQPAQPATSFVPMPGKASTGAGARAEVLSRIADAPSYGPFFDKLRSEFPGEYTGLVDDATDALTRGGHVPNPDRLLVDAMRRVRLSRGILAAQAESGPLSSIFAAQGLVLDLLAADSPALCADFIYGGSSPEFMAFAATHRDAIERLALSGLDAVVSGQAKRVEHPPPTPQDIDALGATLRADGLSEDQIATVLDGKTFDPPLPAAQVCDAGRSFLRAARALPDDARDRVYALSAALLARS